jgi:hypothetical protein
MERYVLHWGEINALKVNRTVLQIHALLYLAGRLPADEIRHLDRRPLQRQHQPEGAQSWGCVVPTSRATGAITS